MRKTLRIVLATSLCLAQAVGAFAQVPPLPSGPADAPATPEAPRAPMAPAAPQAPGAPPPATLPPAAPTPAAPPPIEERPLADAAPSAQDKPTMERFKETLAPHGRWMETPEYGTVWAPRVTSPTWRPYTNGRWVYTERGWTFVANEPWGWAPFHYGRWVYYPPTGWVWLPGYEWSPAWVSWRYGGGYIGWAPLGPAGVAASYYDTPSLWLCVRGPWFYRPLALRNFVRTTYIHRIFRTTYFAGVPRVGVYYSPPARYISAVVGRPIHQLAASRVAPHWAKHGVYRPAGLRDAFRGARVIATPTGKGLRPGTTRKFVPRTTRPSRTYRGRRR